LRTEYFQEFLIDEFSSGRAAAKVARVQERMGLFGLSFAAPTLDDMVVEFVLAVPPDQFIAQGARRSLLRRATKGVLPERIRLRTDKTPYLPDVVARKREIGAAAKEYFLATEADDETWKLVDRRRALEAADIAAEESDAKLGERIRYADYAFNAANILAFMKYARESSKLNQSIIDSRM
jgi:asparagine synthase (glutamine-hydrolysing)